MKIGSILLLLTGLSACHSGDDPKDSTGHGINAEEKRMSLYLWAEFLAPNTISDFEKETGIEVNEVNYASLEELDAKLAAGESGYDVVVTSGAFYERQIRAGYYQKLDKAKLPNLSNMDTQVLHAMAVHDPGNDYAVLHTWGAMGIGYNVAKVRTAAADAPMNSWKLAFDPTVVSRLRKCGIAVVDSPADVLSVALIAVGKDSNSQNATDLQVAADALGKIRPYVRYVSTVSTVADLANGDICMTLGYVGDFMVARDRARQNKTGQKIAYVMPKEGTVGYFNSFLIPKSARHPNNAHVFINYILQPQVIAAVTNAHKYPNGNSAATPFVEKEIADYAAEYKIPRANSRLEPERPDSAEIARVITRLWTRFVSRR